jgi:hypothetical protein
MLAAGRFNDGTEIAAPVIRARIRVLHVIERRLRDCDPAWITRRAPFLVMPASSHEIEEWLRGGTLPDPVSLGRLLTACLVPDHLIPDWQDALHRVRSGAPGRRDERSAATAGPAGAAFLCYSWADKEQVRVLRERLTADAIRCWLDEEDIMPGQDWEREIVRALESSGFVLACVSRNLLRTSGYVQQELRYALHRAADRAEGSIYLIPVRLEPCEMPDELRHLHPVDLFEPGGYRRLVQVLRYGHRLRSAPAASDR